MLAVDLLVAVPLVAAALSLVAGRLSVAGPRWVALAGTLGFIAMLVSLVDDGAFAGAVIEGSQLAATSLPLWAVRVDGLATPFLALTALLGPITVLSSWQIREHPAAHHALLLALQASVAGVFLSGDVILFYVFWEAVLVPMFFLIGVWGHEQRRHAALKLFLCTFAGSALMLIGILMAVFSIGTTRIDSLIAGRVALAEPMVVFVLLALGMLVKLPAFPLHTWLPDAHVEAPTAGSILLAGVMLKVGGYGLLRLGIPLAPSAFAELAWVFASLGVVGVVYGAAVALVQSDLKRLVAYSSVAHMGFVLLAISTGTEQGFAAAILVMVSHGIVTPLLFMLVGQLHHRTHTRDLARLGGIGQVAPRWSGAFVFAALASLGLPGLSGFPGELLTVLESYSAWGWPVALGLPGIVLAAAYNLRAVRSVVHGTGPGWTGVQDLRVVELIPVAVLVSAVVIVGVWPRAIVDMTGAVLATLAQSIGGR